MSINIYKSISFILIFSICLHRTKGPRSPTCNYYLKTNSFLSYFLLSLTPCNHQGTTQLLIGQGRDGLLTAFFHFSKSSFLYQCEVLPVSLPHVSAHGAHKPYSLYVCLLALVYTHQFKFLWRRYFWLPFFCLVSEKQANWTLNLNLYWKKLIRTIKIYSLQQFSKVACTSGNRFFNFF